MTRTLLSALTTFLLLALSSPAQDAALRDRFNQLVERHDANKAETSDKAEMALSNSARRRCRCCPNQPQPKAGDRKAPAARPINGGYVMWSCVVPSVPVVGPGPAPFTVKETVPDSGQLNRLMNAPRGEEGAVHRPLAWSLDRRSCVQDPPRDPTPSTFVDDRADGCDRPSTDGFGRLSDWGQPGLLS